MNRSAQFSDPKWITRILDEGQISSTDHDCFWTDAYFHTPNEIEELFSDYDVTKLENVATDGIGILMRDQINKLTEVEFNTWAEYHLNTCHEQSLLGISNHGLYVCRKM